MASKYGFIAQIGADTSGLTAALKGIDTETKKLSTELNQINAALKLDPGNVELVKQQFDVLTREITATQTKLTSLRSTQEQVDAAFARGDLSAEQYRAFNREVINAESSLRRLTAQRDDIDRLGNSIDATTIDVRQLDTAIDRTSSSAGTMSDIFKGGLGARIAGDAMMYASQKLLEFVKTGITLASDLAEVENVIDTAFSGNSEEIYRWAETSSAAFGISTLNAEKYAGQLGAMFSASGLAEAEMTQMSTTLVKLAGDMSSFYNIDTEEMFQKIQSGLTGQVKPLREVGIDMTVLSLNAYATAEGYKKLYDEMSQSEKYQLRYNYLMKQSVLAHDDFTKTIDTFANQQKLATLHTEDLAKQLGDALLPALNKGLHAFNEWSTNGAATEGVMQNIANAAENAADVVVPALMFIVEHLEEIGYLITALAAAKGVYALATGIQAAVAAAAALKAGLVAATTAQAALNTTAAINPIGLALAAAALVAVGLAAGIDAATKSAKELEEVAATAQATMRDAQDVVDDTKTKLDENEKSLKALQDRWASGFKTQALADELEILEATTVELNAQLEIQEAALKIAQENAEKSILDSLNAEGSTTGWAQAKKALDNYNAAIKNLSDEETARDDNLVKAAEARLAGDESTAHEYDVFAEDHAKMAVYYREEWEKSQGTLTDAVITSAAALAAEGDKIAGVTAEGAAAKKEIAEFSASVLDLTNTWSEVPEEVATKYTVSIATNAFNTLLGVVSNAQAVAAAAVSDAQELNSANYEIALENDLTALKHNLATKKITEEQYYAELAAIAVAHKDEEKESYWAVIDEVTTYQNKKAKEAKENTEKAQTEQEKLIKASWDRITKLRERGNIDEEQEYKLKAQLVKDRCADDEETYSDYYEWLYDFTAEKESEIAEANNKAWEESSKEIFDTLEKSYEEIIDKKEKVRQELLDIDLTDTVKDKNGKSVSILTDLDAEIKRIEKLTATKAKLKESGASESLMAQVDTLSYSDGSQQQFVDNLLALTPKQKERYFKDWEDLQAAASKAAGTSVNEDLTDLNSNASDSIDTMFSSMPKSAYETGVETWKAYILGMKDSMGDLNLPTAMNSILSGSYVAPTGTDTATGGTAVATSTATDTISRDTPIYINLNDKAYINTTVGELMTKGRVSGGNNFNL